MKRAYAAALLVVISIALVTDAQAFTFTHSSAEDFNVGAFFQTDLANETVILANETSAAYYKNGTYTRTLSAGKVVNWTQIAWAGTFGEIRRVRMKVQTAPTDACSFTGNWKNHSVSPATLTVPLGYCIQYQAVLSTTDNQTTPVLDEVTVTYDLVYPTVTLNAPANGFVSDSGNVTFQCSAASPNSIINITLFYDAGGAWHANETKITSGTAVFERPELPNGLFKWNCRAYDQTALSAFAPSNRTLIVGVVDIDPPNITHDISPDTVQVGEDVTISVTAVDDTGVDMVWAEITLPNTTVETLELVNEDHVNYTTNQSGTYAVKIYANDTLGNEGYVTDSFSATTEAPPPPPPPPGGPGGPGGAPAVNITLDTSAEDAAGMPVDFTLRVYDAGTTTTEHVFLSSNGTLSEEILSGYYDLEFDSWGGDLVVILEGVGLYSNTTETIGLDKPLIPASGYVLTYGVSNPFPIADAKVRLAYLESLFPGEAGMELHVCTDWNFQDQSCDGPWLLENATLDTSANTMTVNLTSLDTYGFSLKQAGYCGDGVCDADEDTTSCPADCECIEGESRTCGTSDIPPCSLGTQTCTNGKWGPCVGVVEPSEEVCNEMDDDCDGVIDNVFGGTTPEDTSCQCVNGAPPLDEEECNNIDDNCNGQIDEGLQRQCGTDVGVCDFGLSSCTGGAWGPCIGGVEPQTDEICNNGLDDDCDGSIDEDCLPLAGPAAAPEGGFSWDIIFYIMVIALVAMVAFILWRRIKAKAVTWKELEERYGGMSALSWEDLERKYR